jgi:hypothetical protein
MQYKTCRLCLQMKDIVESHLAPRGLYDICRPRHGDPVMITPRIVMHTGRQTKSYLLCLDCEDLLNRSGETWLLPLLATVGKEFPFYDLVTRFPADLTMRDGTAYACAKNPDVDCDMIARFALGVFWKGSAHPWRGGSHDPLVDLGPYAEQLREYILGDGPFPIHMTLTVGVVPKPAKVIAFSEPYKSNKGIFTTFTFYVPGIIFALHVGKALADVDKQACFVSNPLHPIVVNEFSGQIVEMLRGVTKGARKARNVRDKLARYNLA